MQAFQSIHGKSNSKSRRIIPVSAPSERDPGAEVHTFDTLRRDMSKLSAEDQTFLLKFFSRTTRFIGLLGKRKSESSKEQAAD
jgi:hypothetical protein